MEVLENDNPGLDVEELRLMLDSTVAAFLYIGNEISVPFEVADSLVGYRYTLGLRVDDINKTISITLTEVETTPTDETVDKPTDAVSTEMD